MGRFGGSHCYSVARRLGAITGRGAGLGGADADILLLVAESSEANRHPRTHRLPAVLHGFVGGSYR